MFISVFVTCYRDHLENKDWLDLPGKQDLRSVLYYRVTYLHIPNIYTSLTFCVSKRNCLDDQWFNGNGALILGSK